MFDINGAEFVVLLVIVLIVIGPERLPTYAAQLGRLVREVRKMAMGAREQVRAELGPEFDDVDWSKLDPRQYDPRRIVREALSDTLDEPTRNSASPAADSVKEKSAGGPTPVGRSKPATPSRHRAPAEPAAETVAATQDAGRRAHRAPTPYDLDAT